MRPVHTTFDPTAVPSNLVTVKEWRHLGQSWFGFWVSWETVARRYARDNGGAMVMLADDTMVVFTRRGDKVSRSTHRQGTWSWDKKESAS